MDLELDLDEALLADIGEVARRRGMSPHEWARIALRVYLGLATDAEKQLIGSRVRRITLPD